MYSGLLRRCGEVEEVYFVAERYWFGLQRSVDVRMFFFDVLGAVGLPSEGLAAVPAVEASLGAVRGHVVVEVGLASELLGALPTLEGVLAMFSLDVSLERVLRDVLVAVGAQPVDASVLAHLAGESHAPVLSLHFAVAELAVDDGLVVASETLLTSAIFRSYARVAGLAGLNDVSDAHAAVPVQDGAPVVE